MKRRTVLPLIVGILLVGVVSWSVLADSKEQREEIYLGHGYSVGGVNLKPGKYIVIHRPESEKAGDACTYFYRAPYRSDKDAIAKLRCKPSEGSLVKEFTMRSTSQPDGTSVLSSIQFPNSTEIHNFQPGGGG